jgi:hypothetical protein
LVKGSELAGLKSYIEHSVYSISQVFLDHVQEGFPSHPARHVAGKLVYSLGSCEITGNIPLKKYSISQVLVHNIQEGFPRHPAVHAPTIWSRERNLPDR